MENNNINTNNVMGGVRKRMEVVSTPSFLTCRLSNSPYPLAPGGQVAEAVAGASPDYSLTTVCRFTPLSLAAQAASTFTTRALHYLPCIVSFYSTEYHNTSRIDFRSHILSIWVFSDHE